jgi:hypothetical protein
MEATMTLCRALFLALGMAALAPAGTACQQPVSRLPAYVKFPDRQHALVEAVRFKLHGQRRVITIPAGFVTDFASIPPFLRPLFSHDDIHDIPALLHDYLYWTHSCSQEEADLLFLTALREMGVSRWESRAIYAGVRMAGEAAFRENERNRRAGRPRIIPSDRLASIPVMRWSEYQEKLRAERVPLDTPDPPPAPYCKNAR